MKAEDIKKKHKELSEHVTILEEEAKQFVRQILKETGADGISLVGSPAYTLVEGCDYWFEDSIYGIRLREDTIEITLDTNCDDAGNDIPDWDENNCRTEFDHYTDINWLSVLDSIQYCMKKLEEKA